MDKRTSLPLAFLIALLVCCTHCNRSISANKTVTPPDRGEVGDATYRQAVAKALGRNRVVFLYFHTKRIKESRKEVAIFEKEVKASNGKAELILVDAEKNKLLHSIFAVTYAPTVFVLRPKTGIVGTFVVDVNADDVRQYVNGAPGKLSPSQKKISDNIAAHKPTMLFFNAQWCGYCQQMRPEVARFKESHGDRMAVVSVDVDQDIPAADTYMVNGVPDMVILDADGIPVQRLPGPQKYKDFVEAFKSLSPEKPSGKN
jgi:thioredoxin 1